MQLNVNGRVIDNPKQIANEVNEFFVNVGPNTEKEVPKVPSLSPEHFLGKNSNPFNFIIAHTSNEEVIEIIKSLQNKATGPSSIPMKLLHIVADLIVFPLCHIINRFLLVTDVRATKVAVQNLIRGPIKLTEKCPLRYSRESLLNYAHFDTM